MDSATSPESTLSHESPNPIESPTASGWTSVALSSRGTQPAKAGVSTLTLAEEISGMKPTSLGWLVTCVCAVILSALIFISRYLGWLDVHWFVMVCAGAAPLISIYFLVFNYYKKPFVHEYRWNDWIKESEDRKDIYVFIPALIHKQGRRPIIEILSINSPYSTKLVEPQIAANGDIKIVHPENHFTPDAPKEFGVRIVAG